MRSDVRLCPDPARVVATAFLPGATVFAGGVTRLGLIAERAVDLSDDDVERVLADTRRSFASRHHDLEELWQRNAAAAEQAGVSLEGVNSSRRLLVGAFFTHEYALESAAVCNPSMVRHPGGDSSRFVMSVRAIGEGHISSVEFREGRVEPGGTVHVDPPATRLRVGTRRAPVYTKEEFAARFGELGPDDDLAALILAPLGSEFSLADLDESIATLSSRGVSGAAMFETARMAHWVATSNYEVTFPDGPLSERVLMPAGPADSHGIEDVRFTRFVDEDGTVVYYGTYTAFDGFTMLPQLIETTDFSTFRIATLSGSCARNKGMALFPRRIDGRYIAVGRLDQESLYVMRSDRVRSWSEAQLVYRPSEAWEVIQVGNCGAPIETEGGWLVLTHGVGPMRRYSIGAVLLAEDRPEKVIGRLSRPFLVPSPEERDGYVPNVVYSCGGLACDRTLVVPYGFSDRGVGIVTLSIEELLDEMVPA